MASGGQSDATQGIHVMDTGTCERAINVDPPPQGHWILQDAINRWHQQAYIHAITENPNWLILRINRFQDASDGTSKIRSPMQWAVGIQMPIFNEATLSFSEVGFQLRACIVHLGERATSGHYRALLIQNGDEVGRRYCDDGCKSRAIRSFDEVSRDVSCCSLFVTFLHRISLGNLSCMFGSGLQLTTLRFLLVTTLDMKASYQPGLPTRIGRSSLNVTNVVLSHDT